MEPLIFESCHSTWFFDTEGMQFRRVLKGAQIGSHHVATGWRPYYGLDIDPSSESFAVLLTPDGSRILRSWRHTGDCAQCGGHVTTELSAEEVRAAAAHARVWPSVVL